MNIKNIKRAAFMLLAVAVSAAGLYGCRVSYTFSGASIPPEAKTFSVAHFPNNAAMVTPTLSPAFTEALKDRFSKQTKLTEVTNEPGDFAFEGEIVDYTTTPAAISGQEQAVRNRLTIRVRVRFTNAIDPKGSFDKTFQQFSEYSVNTPLQEAENTLIPEIVDMLVDDIFNAAASNW